MLKKITAAITCLAVAIAALCGSVFAENERWWETYVPNIYSPNVTYMDFWNFTVGYETDERGALTEEAPWVTLKLQNQEVPEGIDIDTSKEYFKDTNSGEISKRVPNGFGYNWADTCYASGNVKVVVDGKEVEFPDAEPFIDINGRTMVPLRFVSEALGAKVRDDQRDAWAIAQNRCKMYWNDFGRRLYSAMDDPEGIFVKVPVFIDTGHINLTIWTTDRDENIHIQYNIGNDTISSYKIKYGNDYIDDQIQDQEPVKLDSVGFLKNNRTYIPLRFFSEVLGAKVDWDNENRTVVITSSKN